MEKCKFNGKGKYIYIKQKDDKREGKGIFYYNNDDRSMGDYYNDEPIRKHVLLTKNGEVEIYNH